MFYFKIIFLGAFFLVKCITYELQKIFFEAEIRKINILCNPTNWR